jgi:hypothetical protein
MVTKTIDDFSRKEFFFNLKLRNRILGPLYRMSKYRVLLKVVQIF